MRAIVSSPFHDPVNGKLYCRGDVLADKDLTWLPTHPDLEHNLTFSNRSPGIIDAPPGPEPVVIPMVAPDHHAKPQE